MAGVQALAERADVLGHPDAVLPDEAITPTLPAPVRRQPFAENGARALDALGVHGAVIVRNSLLKRLAEADEVTHRAMMAVRP